MSILPIFIFGVYEVMHMKERSTPFSCIYCGFFIMVSIIGQKLAFIM